MMAVTRKNALARANRLFGNQSQIPLPTLGDLLVRSTVYLFFPPSAILTGWGVALSLLSSVAMRVGLMTMTPCMVVLQIGTVGLFLAMAQDG